MSKYIETHATPDSLMDYIQGKPTMDQIRIIARFMTGNHEANRHAPIRDLITHPRFRTWIDVTLTKIAKELPR